MREALFERVAASSKWLATLLVLVCPLAVFAQPVARTTQPIFAAGEDVTVTYKGLPGHPQDAIAIALPASPLTSAVDQRSTSAAIEGTFSFGNLPPGAYVVRALQGSSLLSESVPFQVTASATGWWPEAQSVASHDASFIWPDTGATNYYLALRHPPASEGCGSAFPAPPGGCDTPVYSTALARTAVCLGNGYCRLRPGMPGYPTLEARAYRWTITVPGWTWRLYYALPQPPAWAAANWVGTTLEMSWGGVSGAASYMADIGNVFTKDYTEDYLCSTAVCSGTSNVSHIPFGTILVGLRSCGLHGKCTQRAARTEAYRIAPAPISAPLIVSPEQNSTVAGGVILVWLDQANVERWNIRIEKNTGGPLMETVSETAPWRPMVKCALGVCTRPVVLNAGEYLLTMTAYSGGVWSASHTIAFNVDGSTLTPTPLSPLANRTTGIYPLFAWKRVAGVSDYLVTIATATTSTERIVSCATDICSYDLHAVNAPLDPGEYRWTVRINVADLPSSEPQAFTTSYSYAPPAPEITMPQQLAAAAAVTPIVFLADVQATSFSAHVAHPQGYSQASALFHRHASNCELVRAGGELRLSCIQTLPTYCDTSKLRIKTYTYTNMSGGSSSLSESLGRDVTRSCSEAGPGGTQAIYRLFALNTQFLPIDLQHVYNVSTFNRATALAQYMIDNKFEVVALSEMFKGAAQDVLGRSFGSIYDFGVMINRIDSAGDPLLWFREGLPYEAVSGLAIYSNFQAVKLPETWDSNSQCTSDLFNQVAETYALGTTRPTPLNDHLWFNQYCEAEGMDALSAKGFAAIRLDNSVTGIPLVVGWSHTQAMTDQGLITEAGLPLPNDYSYKDSHWARDEQFKEARDSMNYILGKQPPQHDAFIFGDWNLPQPKSVGRAPSWDGTTQTNGGVDLMLAANPDDPLALYDMNCATGCDDAKNPSFASLVGDDYDPTPDGWSRQNLYSQYWSAFDPRHGSRYFPQFYDLWLEQPAGDWGLTFDRTRASARCDERGEPCHGNDPQGFDRGQRYDLLQARLHASVMPNHRNTGSYASGTPFNGKQSCVQHTRIAKDFQLSDHLGTVVEVGPDAPFCSPMLAKAAAQARVEGAPPNYVPPNGDNAHNKYLGVHIGNFAHGGANQWLYISEAGGYDFIHEGGQKVRIEAYQPNDLSTLMNVADSTQSSTAIVGGGDCNSEINDHSIEQNGYIARECAKPDTRVTYKSPGPFYARIYAVNPDGSRCLTCTGNYRVRVRARSCKVVYEAVPTFPGLVNPKTDGWYGPGQTACWFSVELREPSLANDFQTFVLGDLLAANASRCAAAEGGGQCSDKYEARVYRKEAADLNIAPHERPPIQYLVNGPFVHNAGSTGSDILVGGEWDVPSVARDNGKQRGDYRAQYLWLIERSDKSRKHEVVMPWWSNLKSVTYATVTALDIDDDDKVIPICVPFLGCAFIKDPFQTEDEVILQLNVNGATLFNADREMSEDSVYDFPNTWPGAQSQNETGFYVIGGDKPDRGYTVNFTGTTSLRADEDDDDSHDDALIADHLMVGIPTPGGGLDKQTHEITYFKIQDPQARYIPFTWEFTDAGWDAPIFGDSIPIAGYKVRYRVIGRILRD